MHGHEMTAHIARRILQPLARYVRVAQRLTVLCGDELRPATRTRGHQDVCELRTRRRRVAKRVPGPAEIEREQTGGGLRRPPQADFPHPPPPRCPPNRTLPPPRGPQCL